MHGINLRGAKLGGSAAGSRRRSGNWIPGRTFLDYAHMASYYVTVAATAGRMAYTSSLSSILKADPFRHTPLDIKKHFAIFLTGMHRKGRIYVNSRAFSMSGEWQRIDL
jgi:hypothetical protein